MYKKNLLINSILFVLYLTLTNTLNAQNISFSAPEADEYYIGETLTLENTSIDVPEGSIFKWEFSNCSFAIEETAFCEYTNDRPENIEGYFLYAGHIQISLSAQNADGEAIGETFIRSFYVASPPPYCSNDCHDAYPFSCNNPNLICNPSFEYISGPISYQGQVNLAHPWCQISNPDIFQPGASGGNPSVSLGVPSNNMGYQTAHSGDNYVGLITHYHNCSTDEPTNDVEIIMSPIKEVIQNGQTRNTLYKDQRYKLSFYFSKAEESKYATDGVQAYFANNIIGPAGGGATSTVSIFDLTYDYSKVLKPFNQQIITDYTNWTHFEEEYIPETNDIKYLYLGYFKAKTTGDVNKHYQKVHSNTNKCTAYYYIDDVSVTPLPPLVTVNSPTSNCEDVELKVSGSGHKYYTWSTGATSQSITVNPTTTTTYTVTVTDHYNCNPVVLQSVVTVNTPVEPEIIGNHNNCNPDATYNIGNVQANYQYQWSTQIYNATTGQYTTGQFIMNGNLNTATGNQVSIDWGSISFPSLPNYVVLTATASDNEGNCTSSKSINIYQCCEGDIGPDGIFWHDQSITSQQTINNTNMSINGTIIVEDQLTINNAVIFMGPQAKIELINGGQLEFNNCVLREACEYMWDGIYAYSKSEVITMNSTDLSNAINGVVLSNGAPIYADDCDFDENLVSIQIKDYKRTNLLQSQKYYSGTIYNCRFNNSNGDPLYSSHYYSLMHPHLQEASECAIKITNIDNVTIGDKNKAKNVYNRLRYGIMTNNSGVTLENNEFRFINDVNNTGWFSFIQGAVFAQSSGYSALQIGSTAKFINVDTDNKFIECQTGVFTIKTRSNISNNYFESCQTAMRIINPLSNSNIESNDIKKTKEGILVHKPVGGYRGIRIKNNVMPYSSELKTGISIVNINSALGPLTQIANNTIKFTGIQNYQRFGIQVINCNGIKVNSNHIRRASISFANIGNTWNKMIGIKTDKSKACEITDNYMLSMGTGILIANDCSSTNYSCNDLIINKFGFYLGASSKITDQGAYSSWNTYNRWTAPSVVNSEKIATNNSYSNLAWIGDVDWFYNTSYSNNYIPNSIGVNPGPRVLAQQNNVNTHHCFINTNGSGISTGGGPTSGSGTNIGTLHILEDEAIIPEVREFISEDMAQGVENYEMHNEFRAHDAGYIYDMLEQTESRFWLNNIEDVNYDEYVTEMHSQSLGQFINVQNLIEEGNYEEAIAENEAIVPDSDHAWNMQNVLRIYLNSWAQDRFILNEEEYNYLFEIASMNPNEGGDAVHTARIMTNHMPDFFEERQAVVDELSIDAQLKVYPNPAKNTLILELSDASSVIEGQIKIYTLTGKVVLENDFTSSGSNTSINVEQLSNGVYSYSIELKDSETKSYINKSGKLIILK